MRRRQFLGLVGGAAAWPAVARAQQTSMPVIGFMHIESAMQMRLQLAGFHAGLKEGGFVDGQNVIIDYRWAEGHAERLPAMAADLVQRRVAVITAVGGTNSSLAAKKATTTIPIVFSTGGDPVKIGLVQSLARPGGNIPGVANLLLELNVKRLEILKQAAHLTVRDECKPPYRKELQRWSPLQKTGTLIVAGLAVALAYATRRDDREF